MEKTRETNLKEDLLKFRRRFLQLAASMSLGLIGFTITWKAEGAGLSKREFKPLNKDDRIDIGGREKEIIDTAYKLGFEYEKCHMGCSRCTVASLQDSMEFFPADKSLFRAASCLDGGATPTKLASCGAFTGAGMIIGWICGTGRFGDNTLSHDLIHRVHERFKKEYGSVICKDVRENADRNCPEVVGKAARWTAEILLEQFTNHKKSSEKLNRK